MECIVIQLMFLSFRGAPEFLGAYHVLISLSFSFSMWILLLLVQVKHKRTLYRFLLQKKEFAKITRIKTQKHNKNNINGRINSK